MGVDDAAGESAGKSAGEYDTAIVRTGDERCDLVALAWLAAYRPAVVVHLVAVGDLRRFAVHHPATVFAVGVRPGTAGDATALALALGRPVVAVPADPPGW